MNGVIAVALATGQDTRALEAGAHTYAAKSGK
jgi:hydroxymethylglutaryl-CoA reductase